MAINNRLRWEILRRDGFRCAYCHREVPLTIDHIKPKSLGGDDSPTNLVASCEDCNSGKTSTLPGGATIEGPDEDVIRWLGAMKRAAYLAFNNEVAKEAHRGNFKFEWDRWRFSENGSTVPLPEAWSRTVDEFYAAGLPDWAWNLIVTQSMAKTVHGDRFQHACRLAWQWVKELREGVRLSLSRAEEVVELAVGNWVTAYEYNSGRVADDGRRAEVRDLAAKYLGDGVTPDLLLHAATAGGACDDTYFRGFERKAPEETARIREAVKAWRRAYSFRQFDDGVEPLDVKEPDLVDLDSFEQDVRSAIEIEVDQLPILAAAVEAGRDLTCELSAYLPELAEHYDEFASQFTSIAKGGQD